nr:hypothetical protein BaRGS_013248 [Batillaria attramentaria]
MKRLLADKEVDEKDDEDNTLLHLAADTGDLDAVKIAVKSGASLTARNKAGDRPFQLALKRRNENDTESAATPEVSTEAFRKACRTVLPKLYGTLEELPRTAAFIEDTGLLN